MHQNNHQLFLEALENNQDRLFGLCQIYTRDSEMAKDLFQEVLVQLWKSIQSFHGQASIATWMYRVTLNVCLRFHQNHQKHQQRFFRLDSLEFVSTPEAKAVKQPDARLPALRQCIQSLNEGNRALVGLYLEGLSHREIAEVLGISENYVAVKLKRIKVKLLHCINLRL